VKASRIFFDETRRAGGRAVMSATGHSIIKQRMHDEDALLAGEMSGHIFFRDRYFGFDDALYATLRLIEIIASGRGGLSGLLADLPVLESTPELREDCPDAVKFSVVSEVLASLSASYPVSDLDGVRVDFPSGWGLLRASNTQPMLVMRFEAESTEALISYERLVRNEIEKARRKLDVEAGHRGN
jgi:phosphomannomutase/phosphoglucomutase